MFIFHYISWKKHIYRRQQYFPQNKDSHTNLMSEHKVWAHLQNRSTDMNDLYLMMERQAGVPLNHHYHDDIIKWKHFPCNWPFVRGIHQPPVDSPHKGQWREALMFSLICAWTNGWANNQDVGDFRCHSTHYDIRTKMSLHVLLSNHQQLFNSIFMQAKQSSKLCMTGLLGAESNGNPPTPTPHPPPKKGQ